MVDIITKSLLQLAQINEISTNLLSLLEISDTAGSGLLLALALLQEGLRDENLVLGRDGAIDGTKSHRSVRSTYKINIAEYKELQLKRHIL